MVRLEKQKNYSKETLLRVKGFHKGCANANLRIVEFSIRSYNSAEKYQ